MPRTEPLSWSARRSWGGWWRGCARRVAIKLTWRGSGDRVGWCGRVLPCGGATWCGCRTSSGSCDEQIAEAIGVTTGKIFDLLVLGGPHVDGEGGQPQNACCERLSDVDRLYLSERNTIGSSSDEGAIDSYFRVVNTKSCGAPFKESDTNADEENTDEDRQEKNQVPGAEGVGSEFVLAGHVTHLLHDEDEDGNDDEPATHQGSRPVRALLDVSAFGAGGRRLCCTGFRGRTGWFDVRGCLIRAGGLLGVGVGLLWHGVLTSLVRDGFCLFGGGWFRFHSAASRVCAISVIRSRMTTASSASSPSMVASVPDEAVTSSTEASP